MSKKLRAFTDRNWSSTAFRILQERGKVELDIVSDRIRKFTTIFKETLQKLNSLLLTETKTKIHIPFFIQVISQLELCQHNIKNKLNQEAKSIEQVICDLANHRMIVQTSEVRAKEEYENKIQLFLKDKKNCLTYEKIEKIQTQALLLEKQRKQALLQKPTTSKFSKWFIDFSLRSETFFNRIFFEKTNLNIENLTREKSFIRFLPLNPQKELFAGEPNQRMKSQTANMINDPLL